MAKNYKVDVTSQLKKTDDLVQGKYSETMFNIASKQLKKIEEDSNNTIDHIVDVYTEKIKVLKKQLEDLNKNPVANATEIKKTQAKLKFQQDKLTENTQKKAQKTAEQAARAIEEKTKKIHEAANRDYIAADHKTRAEVSKNAIESLKKQIQQEQEIIEDSTDTNEISNAQSRIADFEAQLAIERSRAIKAAEELSKQELEGLDTKQRGDIFRSRKEKREKGEKEIEG